MSHPSLLIVTGPPGSGKSTVSRLLAERPAGPAGPTVLVEGDAFFGFLAAGAIPPWEPASHAQNEVVIDASAAATSRFVAAGWDTIFDGIIGPWFLDRFLDRVLPPADSAEIDYAVLLPPLDRCLERVRTRTGHGFDDEAATAKMHAEFTGATVESRHLVDDDGVGPEATATRLLELRAGGRLRHRQDHGRRRQDEHQHRHRD